MDPADRARLNSRRRKRPIGGWKWDRFAKAVVDRYAGYCHICGHGGARTADHLDPDTEHPDQPWKLERFRAAHGAPGNPCPVCSRLAGQNIYCNNVRGMGSVERARRIIAEKIAANQGRRSPLNAEKPGAPARGQDTGREWLAGPGGTTGETRR
jgi:hypothetical protein